MHDGHRRFRGDAANLTMQILVQHLVADDQDMPGMTGLETVRVSQASADQRRVAGDQLRQGHLDFAHAAPARRR